MTTSGATTDESFVKNTRFIYFSETSFVNYSFLLKYLLWGVTQSAYKPLTHINTPYTFPLRTDISVFCSFKHTSKRRNTMKSKEKKETRVITKTDITEKCTTVSIYLVLVWKNMEILQGGGGGVHRSLISTRHNCTGTTKFHIHGKSEKSNILISNQKHIQPLWNNAMNLMRMNSPLLWSLLSPSWKTEPIVISFWFSGTTAVSSPRQSH